MKVLLAEDDVDLLDVMTYALRREGYTVLTALDGRQAVSRWEAEAPDIALLDVALPKMTGLEVCKRIRHKGNMPVIMVTGEDDEADVLRGFAAGADDYVCKPFSMKQLSARMKALLRRSQPDHSQAPTNMIAVGDLTLDVEAHEARVRGTLIQLTAMEFRILYMLAMNVGRVIRYPRLIEYAWGYDGGDTTLLKTHVSHIRSKLRSAQSQNTRIKVASGVGYSLAVLE